MKDTIIPSAIVAIVFVAILLGAGFWVFTSNSSKDSQLTEAQQEADTMINSMTDTNNTQPAGESYEITPGLTAQDIVIGNGEAVQSGQTVVVKYVGTLEDGTVFDASDAHPDENGGFTFPLGGGMVIKGWDLGVVGMKPGGVRELTIAPELAYGDRDLGPIPPNSTLKFKVELTGVATE